MKARRWIAFLLAAVMLLSTPGMAMAQPKKDNPNKGPAQQAAGAFDNKIINNLNADNAMEHIRVMSKDIGTRRGGLEGEILAADYIQNYFESLGLETIIQKFPVANVGIAMVTVEGAEEFYGTGDWGFDYYHGSVWEAGAAPNGLITSDDASVRAEVVDVGDGTEEEFAAADLAGKIALVKRGLPFADYVARATEADAAGVMIYAVTGGRGNYGSAFSPTVPVTDIPVVGLALAQGQWLKEMIAEGPVFVDVQTNFYTNLESTNVIAVKPAKKNPNAPIVVVGGHYDSVVGSPGANDNASATAQVMELARVLKKFNTDDYEIRFAAWGAEELGLRGARYYVSNLSEEDNARHIAYFNGDMTATSEIERAPYLFAQTVDGKPNIVTDSILAAAKRLGYSTVKQAEFSSSDHVPFHSAGIPAAMLMRFGGEGTPSNYTIERFYHTPQDTMEENISYENLKLSMDIFGTAIFSLTRKAVPALTRSPVNYVDGVIKDDGGLHEMNEAFFGINPER